MSGSVSWEDLEREGWEKRTSPTTKRISFKRPLLRGRRLTVTQRRDLSTEETLLFGDVLFPPKKLKKQVECHEGDAVRRETGADREELTGREEAGGRIASTGVT